MIAHFDHSSGHDHSGTKMNFKNKFLHPKKLWLHIQYAHILSLGIFSKFYTQISHSAVVWSWNIEKKESFLLID